MQQQENVAIFWNFGKCPVPPNISGYEIVRNITSIAHSFGIVKQFKAYLNMSQPASSPTLRSQLQTSGVSLTDCPSSSHTGNDVVNTMLLVDMIAYAIDNPPTATIILITNELDYSYAVSILRLRRYRVVVIAPSGTMMPQASVQLDWNSEVLHAPLEEPMNQPNPPPASRQRADSIPYTSSASRTQYMTDADDIGDDDMYQPYDKYRRGSVSFPTTANGTDDPFTSQQYSGPSPARQAPGGYPLSQPKRSPPLTFQSTKSNQPSPPVTFKTPEPVFVTEGNRLFESSTRTPNLPKGFPYSEPESRTGSKPSFPHVSSAGSSPPSSPSSSIFQPPAIPPAGTSIHEPARTPPPPTVPLVPKSAPIPTVKPVSPIRPPLPLPKPVPGTPAPSSLSAIKGTLNGPTSQSQGPTLKTNQASSNTKSLPLHFVILAQRLQARQDALGQPRIPRTDIGSELAKQQYKSAYSQAGVSTFAAFINLALSAGVVDVGGSGNDQWVSLRPDWAGAAGLSQ